MLAKYSAYSARELERVALNINPGGWAVATDRPIATLLGSCVAVCLFDTKLGLAGMNHFLLPSRRGPNVVEEDIVLSGDYAMEVLRNAMYARGASPLRLTAKAFGGGNVVSSIQMAIGDRNVAFARQWLERENIPLLACDFGDAWSRKVLICPSTGDAYCRRNPIHLPDVQAAIEAETRYEKTLHQEKTDRQGGGKKIELF